MGGPALLHQDRGQPGVGRTGVQQRRRARPARAAGRGRRRSPRAPPRGPRRHWPPGLPTTSRVRLACPSGSAVPAPAPDQIRPDLGQRAELVGQGHHQRDAGRRGQLDVHRAAEARGVVGAQQLDHGRPGHRDRAMLRAGPPAAERDRAARPAGRGPVSRARRPRRRRRRCCPAPRPRGSAPPRPGPGAPRPPRRPGVGRPRQRGSRTAGSRPSSSASTSGRVRRWRDSAVRDDRPGGADTGALRGLAGDLDALGQVEPVDGVPDRREVRAGVEAGAEQHVAAEPAGGVDPADPLGHAPSSPCSAPRSSTRTGSRVGRPRLRRTR